MRIPGSSVQRFLRLALVACCTVALNAQTDQEPGSLAGRVVNALTGDVLPGTTVRLLSLGPQTDRSGKLTTTSQPDGSFHFDSVAPGPYLVGAEHEGFSSSQPARQSSFVTIAAGQSLNDILVSLFPNGSLSGKLLDENGKPVNGARVDALSAQPGRGQTVFRKISEATTDASGAFTLGKLAPGSYIILAAPDSKAPPKAGAFGAVDTFYPSSLTLQEATTLPVAAGQSATGLTITLRSAFTHHIRGKLAQLPEGLQAKALRLGLMPKGEADAIVLNRSTTLNPDLTFDFPGVVAGSYTLRVNGPGQNRRNPRQLLARQDVDVGAADVTGLVLVPSSPITLTGQLTLDAASVQLDPNRISVMAKPLEDLSHGAMAFGKVQPDGTFSLGPLDPGVYSIQARVKQPGLYVSAMTLNQRDVLNREADLSQGAGGQLSITLRTGAGEIDATVQNADSPVMVVLVPELIAPDASNVRIAYPQATNPVALTNLAPGSYLAFAVDRGDPSPWSNPAFLHEVLNLGNSVHLDDNARQTIQVSKTAAQPLEDIAVRLGIPYAGH